MDATDVLNELTDLGITARASGEKLLLEPGSKVPPSLLVKIKEHKTELLELVDQTSDSIQVGPTTACACNPLPSQGEYGHRAQAGCPARTRHRSRGCDRRWYRAP